MREPGTEQRRGGSLGPETLFRIIGSYRHVAQVPIAPGFARRRASAVSGVNAGIQANLNCVGKLVNDRMTSAARVTPATRWKGSGRYCSGQALSGHAAR